jgi:hypothetical protein
MGRGTNSPTSHFLRNDFLYKARSPFIRCSRAAGYVYTHSREAKPNTHGRVLPSNKIDESTCIIPQSNGLLADRADAVMSEWHCRRTTLHGRLQALQGSPTPSFGISVHTERSLSPDLTVRVSLRKSFLPCSSDSSALSAISESNDSDRPPAAVRPIVASTTVFEQLRTLT